MTIDPITADDTINVAESKESIAVTGTVSGEVKTGDTVTLTVDGHTYTGAVSSTNGVLGYSINVPGSVLAGASSTSIQASVTISDAAGNSTTATATEGYTVDTTGPAAGITIDPITADDTINLAESKENIAVTGTVSGDVKAGDTVTLTVDGHTYTGTVATNLTYSVSIPGSVLAAASSTSIQASVTISDAAGNSTTATATEGYTVDTTGPAAGITIDPITADDTINLAESKENIAVTGTVSGEVKTGDTVTLTLQAAGQAAVTYTGEVKSDGTYSIDVKGSDLVSDADHTIEASVTTSDKAGNSTTASTTESYGVDTTINQPGIELNASSDSGDSDSDDLTNDTTPTFTLTNIDQDVVKVEVFDGSTSLGEATKNADGKWTFTAKAGDLSEGQNNLTATATDKAGNTATSKVLDVTLDTKVTVDAGISVEFSHINTTTVASQSAQLLGSLSSFLNGQQNIKSETEVQLEKDVFGNTKFLQFNLEASALGGGDFALYEPNTKDINNIVFNPSAPLVVPAATVTEPDTTGVPVHTDKITGVYQMTSDDEVFAKDTVQLDTIKANDDDNFLEFEGDLKGSTIVTEDGDDVVVANGDLGGSTILLGDGNDQIKVDGKLSGSTINAGNGDDIIEATGDMGASTFITGDGKDSVNLSGQMHASTINTGNGNDSVTLSGQMQASSIYTGGGDDVVVVDGPMQASSIYTGDGNDIVVVDGDMGASTIATGAGNDIIAINDLGWSTVNGGSGTDVLYLGKTADHYKFESITFSCDVNGLGNMNGILVDKDTGEKLFFYNIEGFGFGKGDGVALTNTETTYEYKVDISAAVTSVADNAATLTVTIIGVPDNATLSEGTKNSDGTWTINVPHTSEALDSIDKDLTMTVPDGNTNFSLGITATATDAAGNTATASANSAVDVGATEAPAVTIVDDANHDGFINKTELATGGDGVQIQVAVDNSQLEAGGNVTLTIDNGETESTVILSLKDGKLLDSDGQEYSYDSSTGTISFTETVADGSDISVAAIQTNSLGVASEQGQSSAIVDTTATATPTVKIMDDINDNKVISKAELALYGPGVQVSVSVDGKELEAPNGSVSLNITNNGVVTAVALSLIVNDDGSYKVVSSDEDDPRTYSYSDNTITWTETVDEGASIDVKATQTDSAGNVSGAGEDSATVDITHTHSDTGDGTEDHILSVNADKGVLSNDSDLDGGLTVSTFTVEGDNTSYSVGSTVVIKGTSGVDDGKDVGTLTLNADGSYKFVPTANWSGDVPQVTYTTSTGASDTLSIKIAAVADTPEFDTTNSVHSNGLNYHVWNNVDSGAGHNAVGGKGVDPARLAEIVASHSDSAAAVSSTVDGIFAAPSKDVGTLTVINGFIYLEKGNTYQFTGNGDDSLYIKVGAEVDAQAEWGHDKGAIDSKTITVEESGYYPIVFAHHNQTGPGDYNVSVSINNGDPVTLDTEHFELFTDVKAIEDAGIAVSDDDGHLDYYVPEVRDEGASTSNIPLTGFTVTTPDKDGSETLGTTVTGAPVGTTLTITDSQGHPVTYTFESTNQVIDLGTTTDFNNMSIKAPDDYSGSFSLAFTATSTEASNHDTASATKEINVTVDNMPTASGGSVEGVEDTALSLSWSELNISDSNSDSSLSIKVTQLSGGGELQVQGDNGNWQTVAVGSELTKAQFDGGNVRFVPGENESGIDGYGGTGVGNQQADYAHIGFKPVDSHGLEGDEATLAVDIKPVADAPDLTISIGDLVDSDASEVVVKNGETPVFTIQGGNISLSGGGVVINASDSTYNKSGNINDNNSSQGHADVIVVNGRLDSVTSGGHHLNNINGGNGLDYLYLNGSQSDYTISAGVNINNSLSNYYGSIKDANGNIAVNFNNIGGIIFGDGTSYNDALNITKSSGSNTYELDLAAALTDTDGSETLSGITLSGVPTGAVIHGDGVSKLENCNWYIDNPTGKDLKDLGLTITVPNGSDAYAITATATSSESVGGDSESAHMSAQHAELNLASAISSVESSVQFTDDKFNDLTRDSSSATDSQLTWGADSTYGRSALSVENVASSSNVNTGDEFVVAKLTHVNQETSVDKDSLVSTNLAITAALTINGTVVNVDLSSLITADDTLNSGSQTGDSLTLTASSIPVEVNGVRYNVSLDGFLDSNNQVVTTVTTPENQTNTYSVVAHVEPVNSDSLNSITGILHTEATADDPVDHVVASVSQPGDVLSTIDGVSTITNDQGVFSVSADGHYTYTASDSLMGSLSKGHSQDVNYEYTVVDKDGDSVTNSINITVHGTGSTVTESSGTTFESGASAIENAAGNPYYAYSDSDWGNSLQGNNPNNWRSGNDTIYGNGGDDTIYGLGGNDLLTGDDGNDELHGGDGNDFLLGGSGDDTLFGDAGNDVLDGGSGHNVLTGGSGDDLFILDKGATNTITDFNAKDDALDITDLLSGATGDPGKDASTDAIESFLSAHVSVTDKHVKVDGHDVATFGSGNSGIADHTSFDSNGDGHVNSTDSIKVVYNDHEYNINLDG
ncbi:Ig-like domain-containing protein [Marinomonas spartinae]|uniref:Ig-like domain-containing protein n=1 Tax=Marinomonas spartinae TaxID=1792290 RepID=UPI002D7FBE07|nr:Ig-like domain-containing protein [Marinomonas spartinae]